MGLPRSSLRSSAECVLTADQRLELLSRFAVGRATLTGRPSPDSTDEGGHPVLTHREWGEMTRITSLEPNGLPVHLQALIGRMTPPIRPTILLAETGRRSTALVLVSL